jgi:hypothetical protein
VCCDSGLCGAAGHALGDSVPIVAERLGRLMACLRPSTVVGAAADGADLLLLEAALAVPDGPNI